MFSRFAVFILAAVVSVPSVTAICNGKGFGISADHHTDTAGAVSHEYDVYHTDCHLYETLNFATDEARCTSGIFECSGSTVTSYTDSITNTTYACHAEANSGACGGTAIVACCHND